MVFTEEPVEEFTLSKKPKEIDVKGEQFVTEEITLKQPFAREELDAESFTLKQCDSTYEEIETDHKVKLRRKPRSYSIEEEAASLGVVLQQDAPETSVNFPLRKKKPLVPQIYFADEEDDDEVSLSLEKKFVVENIEEDLSLVIPKTPSHPVPVDDGIT